ncbi:hypothetical protein Poli38472_003247 [Pythium oligandrum]|uniref:Conserved oligomeric Golgi complex subunit 5 n=1 Tax=Pythium oligandrum TaxID=41045 RepID=A0A8K1C6A0_PYTOL|nr:hypothetical protein Poli38472_003247 [Pythium oligandrum]|eukprot:TMW57322.1 hypothetical protein Poli38472_003247 [Pythium oligandrum]
MEAIVKELRKDEETTLTTLRVFVAVCVAQLSVFLASDCNVSAIASEVVAKDSAGSNGATDAARQRAQSFSLYDGGSNSERFIQRIDDVVQRIDRVITEHISEHHTALLEHVGSVDGLQGQVASIQGSVHVVKQVVHDLEATVRAQHDRLARDIQKHRNVEKCGELVRRLLRFQQLAERVLGSSVGDGKANGSGDAAARQNAELVTVAVAIREIESLTADLHFEDLSVVRRALPNIRRTSNAIRRDVRNHLKTGVQRLSQADVGEALQILFYLGSLTETVQTTVNGVIQEVERKCGAVIAEERLVTRNAANGTEVTVQKADIWRAIQEVFECVRVHALQVWNLQRVLAKMIDPSTGRNFLDMVIEKDEPTLFATFWEVSCAIVRELFSATLSYRSSVKTILIASYPRMREEGNRVLAELHAATAQRTDLLNENTTTSQHQNALHAIAGSAAERNQLLDAMTPLADAFIERCYRRIASPIELMFPQSANFHTSPPSRSDMQTLARTIFAEMELVGHDAVLIERVSQQIHKAVHLFCTTSKKILNTGKAAVALMPTYGRTANQAHNIALLSALYQLDDMITQLEARLGSTARGNAQTSTKLVPSSTQLQKQIKALQEKEFAPCHEQIQELQYTILGPYLQALAGVLESIFAKMHDESFADQTTSRDARGANAPIPATNPTGGSRYMSEFSSVFNVIIEEHIRRMPSVPCVTTSVSAFIARLMSVFIRHAALVRPLEENGKLRLANDMAQLELRLESVLPLRSLGAPYDELRAFRHLIFLESHSILRDSMVDKIRPSNVWHHLISRAPLELQLPHHMKRWSAARYVEWLDKTACTETMPSSAPVSFSPKTLPLGYPCLVHPKLSILAEKEAWKEVSKCLEAYVQRVGANPDAEISALYEILQESNAILLAGYELVSSR